AAAVGVGAAGEHAVQVGQRAVVGVEHAGLGRAAGLGGGAAQAGKEQPLGGAVGVVGLVVVEVFVGDVGDHRHVELAGGHALLGQAVRGDLQHAVGEAGGHHARQVALNGGGVGRGDVEAGVERLVADDGADGGDEPRPQPGGEQNGME